MSYRPQFTKYEFPKEPRSTTELVIRQLAIFALLGGIVLFFYIIGLWDELIVEVKKLFSSKRNPKTQEDRPVDKAKAASPESKKDRPHNLVTDN
ncbi:MAG: hypothetical protein GOMPHAMPRED_005600 [Gomphillus americanus]|uniref:Uncharacterized protein n=1 Tax=Gomphillus americanus TaxID=1940652 RepID=A0A8H3FWA5_9LECA|nr:MAG: hypothetical protein GOMPHAMPRED_005600 [Gomphillus americanus]